MKDIWCFRLGSWKTKKIALKLIYWSNIIPIKIREFFKPQNYSKKKIYKMSQAMFDTLHGIKIIYYKDNQKFFTYNIRAKLYFSIGSIIFRFFFFKNCIFISYKKVNTCVFAILISTVSIKICKLFIIIFTQSFIITYSYKNCSFIREKPWY